jgi:hypothetical protein
VSLLGKRGAKGGGGASLMVRTLNVVCDRSVGMRNEEERPLGKDTFYIG